jgi:hypothetical protein
VLITVIINSSISIKISVTIVIKMILNQNNYKTVHKAAAKGDLEYIKNMIEINPKCVNWRTFASASKKGHLECMKYLYLKGYKWSKRTVINAARYGHLNCLEFAHQKGCPVDNMAVSFAAKNGHIECLEYLLRNGYIGDKWVIKLAFNNYNLDCVKLAHKYGCIWDAGVPFDVSVRQEYIEGLEYIISIDKVSRHLVMNTIVNDISKSCITLLLKYKKMREVELKLLLDYFNKRTKLLDTNNTQIRNYLFSLKEKELEDYTYLHRMVEYKKEEIKMRMKYVYIECSMLPTDIIKYCICDYI